MFAGNVGKGYHTIERLEYARASDQYDDRAQVCVSRWRVGRERDESVFRWVSHENLKVL
jgi:hypothetical protein